MRERERENVLERMSKVQRQKENERERGRETGTENVS